MISRQAKHKLLPPRRQTTQQRRGRIQRSSLYSEPIHGHVSSSRNALELGNRSRKQDTGNGPPHQGQRGGGTPFRDSGGGTGRVDRLMGRRDSRRPRRSAHITAGEPGWQERSQKNTSPRRQRGSACTVLLGRPHDAVRTDGSLTRPGKNDPVHFHLPAKLPQGRGAVRTMRSSPRKVTEGEVFNSSHDLLQTEGLQGTRRRGEGKDRAHLRIDQSRPVETLCAYFGVKQDRNGRLLHSAGSQDSRAAGRPRLGKGDSTSRVHVHLPPSTRVPWSRPAHLLLAPHKPDPPVVLGTVRLQDKTTRRQPDAGVPAPAGRVTRRALLPSGGPARAPQTSGPDREDAAGA